MELQGKLMKQTWGNSKKPTFGTILAPLHQIKPQIFFHRFYLYYMLDIVASYHCMELQGKLMKQTWGNSKKPTFGTILAPLHQIKPQIFFHRFYLYYMLDIVASYHCMQFQGKLMKQTWENSKKPNFGINFGPLPLDQIRSQSFFVDSTFTTC